MASTFHSSHVRLYQQLALASLQSMIAHFHNGCTSNSPLLLHDQIQICYVRPLLTNLDWASSAAGNFSSATVVGTSLVDLWLPAPGATASSHQANERLSSWCTSCRDDSWLAACCTHFTVWSFCSSYSTSFFQPAWFSRRCAMRR